MIPQKFPLFSPVIVLLFFILNFHVWTQQNIILSTYHFPLTTPVSHTQYIKPKEVGQKAVPGSREAILQLCTTPCSRILQVKGEAILVSQYSFLLRNCIWGSSVCETSFPIKVMHSIYSLKYYIKFPCLEKHTLTQTAQCITEFYSLSVFIAAIMHAFLILFIYFGSKYSNQFTFSENLIAEYRVGVHMDKGREQRNCPEIEIHL